MYKGKMWGVEQPGPFEGGPDFQTNAKQGGNVTEANHPRTERNASNWSWWFLSEFYGVISGW